jgi:hypothetical protein
VDFFLTTGAFTDVGLALFVETFLGDIVIKDVGAVLPDIGSQYLLKNPGCLPLLLQKFKLVYDTDVIDGFYIPGDTFLLRCRGTLRGGRSW